MSINTLISLLIEADVVVAGRITKRNRKFDKLFSQLPNPVKDLTRDVFKQWCVNPFDPRLEFKALDRSANKCWSIRIGSRYRALCWAYKSEWLWFWVGSHEAYNKVVRQIGTMTQPTLP